MRMPATLLAALMPLAFAVTFTTAFALAGAPGEACAQEPEAPPPAGPFERDGFGVEFTGVLLGEAWNLNERREWLVDGTAGVWWTFTPRATLVVEFHATRVFQSGARDAYVNGLAPMLRWKFAERGAWRFFTETGAGISWSDTAVPPRGTRFNYLLIAGAGLTRRLGPQTHALLGARLIHVSNASLAGASRNPDIEAIGGFAGLAIGF